MNRSKAYFNLGEAYGEERYYQQAISDPTRAIEMEPDNEDAYTVRWAAYLVLDRDDLADADDKKLEALKTRRKKN